MVDAFFQKAKQRSAAGMAGDGSKTKAIARLVKGGAFESTTLGNDTATAKAIPENSSPAMRNALASRLVRSYRIAVWPSMVLLGLHLSHLHTKKYNLPHCRSQDYIVCHNANCTVHTTALIYCYTCAIICPPETQRFIYTRGDRILSVEDWAYADNAPVVSLQDP